MTIIIFGIIIFVMSILLIELCFYAVRLIRHPDRAAIRKRLKQSLAEDGPTKAEDIYKKRILSDVPFFNQMLSYLPGVERMHLTVKQANMSCTLGFIIFLTLLLGIVGYLTGYLLTHNLFQPMIVAIVPALLPPLYVRMKKKKRMAKFEKQLPEGLGLIARALQAGHAFSSGMKIASEEMEDPLGPEFEETLDEINFGVSVADALKNLARRVDCPDLKFFVVSVILQRETGGNLAEIIEGLAHLIRERFKFRGKVRVLSAEGRLSGWVLVFLPFVLVAALFIVRQKFISPLLFDPIGHVMIAVGAIMMVFGVLAIKKIINVDV